MPEKYLVARPFNSVNRRFKVGDPIVEADLIAGDALGWAARIEAGFISSGKQTEPLPRARRAAEITPGSAAQ